MMRILVATHNYPRCAGDHAGSFVARLAQATAAAGHEVHVIAPHAPGAPRSEVVEAVRVRRFRYAPDALERVAYRGDLHRRRVFDPLALLGVPALLASFALAIRRAIREQRPDVVHAHWWFPAGTLSGLAAGWGSSVPVVITCHGSDVRLLDRGGMIGRLGARTLGKAAAVTSVSQFLMHDVERAVPSLRGRVRTVYMPLDTGAFDRVRDAPRATPPRILFVGNFVPSKGADVLVDAFARLRSRGVDCTLRMVGGGGEERALRARAAAAGVAEAVEWPGFVSHDCIGAEYASSTVLVLPSRGTGEGLGLVLAEALLCGTAVIGTPAGGIPEVVVDGQTGLLARDGDAGHLADQLARLLGDAALRRRLVDAGERHVRATFSPEASAAAFEAIYQDVAGRDP
ncbi:MAG: glycosyltransferase [Gemmatimonadaceae bacterium]|nr:glycosyltransferase [Gemmatimonadaceae bacterium]